MNRRAMWGWIAVLVALAVVSRVPQLRSPNLLVDGDEAVLGLMARHLLHDHQWPLFFWGQRYGLSTFEALAAAASFALFGAGAVPLKIAMLALWIAGVVFSFFAFASLVGVRRSFWIAAVFVLTPAWAVWSMKARGGYLTAFAAAAALLWVVVGDEQHPALTRWAAAGALTAIVYLAQPIWLPAILPIVAVLLVRRRRVSAVLVYAASAAVPAAIVKLATSPGSDTWAGPALGNPSIWGMRVRVAQQIYTTLTGSYYLGWGIDPPGAATRWLAIAWCVMFAALVVMQIYRLLTRSFCRWSHLLFAGAAATIAGNWLLLFARDARYLLPLTGLLVPLVAIELFDLVDRRVIRPAVPAVVAAAALLLGAQSMREFAGFSFLWTNPPGSWSESRRLQQLLNAATSRGATHVFSMNGLLDTQLIFYSDERVISRWASVDDRHPAYVASVDRALTAGEPVAVVGYTHTSGAPGCWDIPICTGGIENLVPNPETIFTVDGKYFVYVGATRELLAKLHFDFASAVRR